MFTIDLRTVRAIDTWSVIVKGRDVPDVLKRVHFEVVDGVLSAYVTDRYRIVLSVIGETYGPIVDGVIDVPVELLARFVAATKGNADNVAVEFMVEDDFITMRDVYGFTVNTPVSKAAYPNISALANNIVARTDAAESYGINLSLLTDFIKIANPNLGILAASKRSNKWTAVVNDRNVWRYSNDPTGRFAVVLQGLR